MVDPGGTAFTAAWMVVNRTTFGTQVPTATTDAINCCALRPEKMTIGTASIALRHSPIVLVMRPPLHKGSRIISAVKRTSETGSACCKFRPLPFPLSGVESDSKNDCNTLRRKEWQLIPKQVGDTHV